MSNRKHHHTKEFAACQIGDQYYTLRLSSCAVIPVFHHHEGHKGPNLLCGAGGSPTRSSPQAQRWDAANKD